MDRLLRMTSTPEQARDEERRSGRNRRANQPDPIAEGLRKLWENVEKEPVPDDFLDILDRVDAAREKERRS